MRDALKVGDAVKIKTPWADKGEFPDCDGIVAGLRHGGNVAVIDTTKGQRTLHVTYFERKR